MAKMKKEKRRIDKDRLALPIAFTIMGASMITLAVILLTSERDPYRHDTNNEGVENYDLLRKPIFNTKAQ